MTTGGRRTLSDKSVAGVNERAPLLRNAVRSRLRLISAVLRDERLDELRAGLDPEPGDVGVGIRPPARPVKAEKGTRHAIPLLYGPRSQFVRNKTATT